MYASSAVTIAAVGERHRAAEEPSSGGALTVESAPWQPLQPSVRNSRCALRGERPSAPACSSQRA